MVFLGDPAQLERVTGKPTYEGGTPGTEGMLKAFRARGARGRRQAVYHATAKGQELHCKFVLSNCVVLCRDQTSCGLLQQILRPTEERTADKRRLEDSDVSEQKLSTVPSRLHAAL